MVGKSYDILGVFEGILFGEPSGGTKCFIKNDIVHRVSDGRAVGYVEDGIVYRIGFAIPNDEPIGMIRVSKKNTIDYLLTSSQ